MLNFFKELIRPKTQIYFLLVTIITVFVFLSGCDNDKEVTLTENQSESARVQQEILVNLTNRMKNDGIPIIAGKIKEVESPEILTVVEYTLQSSSNSDIATPDDMVFLSKVRHEVNLEKSRGFDIDAYHTILFNTEGKILSSTMTATTERKDWGIGFCQAGEMSEEDVSRLLSELPPFGMTIQRITVSSNNDGLMTAMFVFQAENAEKDYLKIVEAMAGIQSMVIELNRTQNTGIALYQIIIHDYEGNVLLHYINDLQFPHESWWQDETVSKDWFPHPK